MDREAWRAAVHGVTKSQTQLRTELNWTMLLLFYLLVLGPRGMLDLSSLKDSEVKVLVTQLCPTLCDPMDRSPPGSSVHMILYARILKWLPSLPQGIPNQELNLGFLHGRQILYHWAMQGSNPHSLHWKHGFFNHKNHQRSPCHLIFNSSVLSSVDIYPVALSLLILYFPFHSPICPSWEGKLFDLPFYRAYIMCKLWRKICDPEINRLIAPVVITLLTKVQLDKAMVFPVVMYRSERWTIKKVESWRIDAFLLGKTLESPLDWKEIKPVSSKENQSQIVIGRTNAEVKFPILWPPDAKNQLIGKDPDAGKDSRQKEKGTTVDEMASQTRWPWVWASSGSWWWTGRPGVLLSMGSQRVRHDLETELNWLLLLILI